ncbi:MAG: hypothetical protein Ct9H90mP22_8030 [Gammaproteobacteria bacterium]|nr:MAG: hypothetical protein Ct9H90mP22_8030 [Gammaproteobacteria bacterium]
MRDVRMAGFKYYAGTHEMKNIKDTLSVHVPQRRNFTPLSL